MGYKSNSSKTPEAHSHSSAAQRHDSQDDAGPRTATPVVESQHAGQKQDPGDEERLNIARHTAKTDVEGKD